MERKTKQLMEHLIPRVRGKIIDKYDYPGLDYSVAYRQIPDLMNDEFDIARLVYNDEEADMMVVDQDRKVYRYVKISPPPKTILHASCLYDPFVDRFASLFLGEQFDKWNKLTKEFLVVGVRFVDNTYGFIRWPEPDDEAHPAYMYRGGEWVENPFVECTDEQKPDLKRAKKGS